MITISLCWLKKPWFLQSNAVALSWLDVSQISFELPELELY